MTNKKLTKAELLEVAVNSVKSAEVNAKNFKTLSDNLAKAGEQFASSVEVACADAYKASLAGVSGADIARGAGVSEMTVSRYIAGGHVTFVTKGKVAGGKVVSDIGNGYLTVNKAKSVKSGKEYGKAVTEGKKAKAGKAGKTKGKATPVEMAKANIQGIVELVKSGAVTLEFVIDAWADAIASLEVAEELAEV